MHPSNFLRAGLEFVKGSLSETKKVVWPHKSATLHTTVFIATLVTGLAVLIWSADKSIEYVIYDVLLHFKK